MFVRAFLQLLFPLSSFAEEFRRKSDQCNTKNSNVQKLHHENAINQTVLIFLAFLCSKSMSRKTKLSEAKEKDINNRDIELKQILVSFGPSQTKHA